MLKRTGTFVEKVEAHLMSVVPGGSIAGGTFGSAIVVAGLVNALRMPKAVIEPKMLDVLSLYGYPMLPPSLFRRLYMSEEAFIRGLKGGSVNQRFWLLSYYRNGLLEFVRLKGDWESAVLDMVYVMNLTPEEAMTLLAAVQRSVKDVLVYRPDAIEAAIKLGLTPWSPRKLIIYAVDKGILSEKELLKVKTLSFDYRDLAREKAIESVLG